MRNKRIGQILLALILTMLLAVSGFAAVPGTPEGGIDFIDDDVGPPSQTLYASTHMGQTKVVQRLQIIDDDTGPPDNPLVFTQATIDNTGSADDNDITQVRLLDKNDNPVGLPISSFPGTINLAGYTIPDDGNDTLQVEVTLSTIATGGHTFKTSIDLKYDEGATKDFVTGPIVDLVADTIARDEAPPTFSNELPEGAAIIGNNQPVVSVDIVDQPSAGVDPSTIEMTIDGTTYDVTNGGIWFGGTFTVDLAVAGQTLDDGTRNVSVTAKDFVLNEDTDTWSFQVETAPADYIGVFRGTPWYLDSDGDVIWNGAVDITYVAFGIAEDRPIAGDWNGDGYDEIGVFRPSTQMWYLDLNGNGAWDLGIDGVLGPFGVSEDLPIAGDWDGVGGDEIGVFRPSTQMWYLDNGNGDWDPGVDGVLGPFGISEDLPIAGDWDGGDDIDEFGVYRPSTGFFYLDCDVKGVWNPLTDEAYDFGGASGDLPIAGDWDGDGYDEIGVFRLSTQMWYLDYDGSGTLDASETKGPFGVSSDRPIAGRWQNNDVTVGPSSVPMSMGSSPVVLVMPNPVTVGGEVTFQVMGAGVNAVKVSIYDLGGGLVYQSELVSGQSVTWDLRFEEGTPVANGIYLYSLIAKANGELITTKLGKLLILR